jgi:transposase, IS30 family
MHINTEFHDYKRIEGRTQAAFYFARPYYSWERGSNENANGLIRQYLPRGTSMAGLSQQVCNTIARKLNTKPRKRFGFRTSSECYNES